MVKCPYCGYESNINEFKLLRDPWRFRFYEVRRLECPKYRRVFNYYYGVTSEGREVKFMIRVKPRG